MNFEAVSPLLAAGTLLGGAAALIYYWCSHPFQMLYHKTGMPHLVGIVTAVHHEKKRFKTLIESVNEMEQLLKKDYHIVLVSSGAASFMVERQYGTTHVKIHCSGAFSEIYADLVKRIPAHLHINA